MIKHDGVTYLNSTDVAKRLNMTDKNVHRYFGALDVCKMHGRKHATLESLEALIAEHPEITSPEGRHKRKSNKACQMNALAAPGLMGAVNEANRLWERGFRDVTFLCEPLARFSRQSVSIVSYDHMNAGLYDASVSAGLIDAPRHALEAVASREVVSIQCGAVGHLDHECGRAYGARCAG